MRVLLVQPRPRGGLGFKNVVCVEPLALEIVAGALPDHEVKILDMLDGRMPTAAVREFDPQAVGISCSFTVDTYYVLQLAQAFKRLNDRLFVFVGGHYASLNAAVFRGTAVDAVVVGEGETTVPALLTALENKQDLTTLPGLALNTAQGMHSTGRRPLQEHLDGVPAPRRDLVERYRQRYFLGFRRPLYTLETSRGCPYHCNFCSVWRFQRGRYRTMSAARVVKDLERLPAGDVFFTDDNFLADVPRAEAIARSLLEKKLPHHRYIMQARSDTIVSHPETVTRWRDIGLDRVFIGFEKINEQGLQGVNKHNSVANNEQALHLLQRLGVGVYASFIVDPQFDNSDFQQLRDYVRRLHIRQPYFSVLTPLPGTELYEKVKEKITSTNYNMYDLLHALLPTKLPLREFYRELAGLYRAAYIKPINVLAMVLWVLRCLVTGRVSIDHIRRLWRGARPVTEPEAYLQDDVRPYAFGGQLASLVK